MKVGTVVRVVVPGAHCGRLVTVSGLWPEGVAWCQWFVGRVLWEGFFATSALEVES